ncbi:hypothetical protein LCGC14_1786430 [marine sediment metagenome]|uniref:Uncharacterized protein n=1 Tax=marine sediment metagenome TaxID=412755 RepID=A0A0F9HGD2_9ZZZZ
MSTELKGRRKKLSTVIEEKAKAMRYNPLAASSSNVSPFYVYPDLKNLEGFRKFHDMANGEEDQNWRNRALWFLIWLYSIDSVLNTKPPEPLPDRKLKALGLAEFPTDPESHRFDAKVIQDLMHIGDPDFVLAILHYLRHQKAEIWAEIIVSEEQHFEALRLRLNPVDPANARNDTAMKKSLRIESKELLHDIRALWDDFWADHDDLREVGQELLFQNLEDRARINTGD